MTEEQLISEIKTKARPYYINDQNLPFDDVHDWGHMQRVYGAAWEILEHEPLANRAEVLIAAILHDSGRCKDIEPHAEESFKIAKALLEPYRKDFESLNIDLEKTLLIIKYHTVAHICPDERIAKAVEFNIMTDADKIEMFGASGILRSPIAQAYKMKPVVQWSIDRINALSEDDQFVFQSRGGKILGQKYKDYMKSFIKELDDQYKFIDHF